MIAQQTIGSVCYMNVCFQMKSELGGRGSFERERERESVCVRERERGGGPILSYSL